MNNKDKTDRLGYIFFIIAIICMFGMIFGILSLFDGQPLPLIISLVVLIVSFRVCFKDAMREQQEKNKQKELEIEAKRNGTWTFPSEEFYEQCAKNHITGLSGSYSIQKAMLLAKEILTKHEVPENVHKVYLAESKLLQYFEEGKNLEKAKKEQAEADRIKKLRLQEIEKERELTRFARYHGKDKRIAMIQAEIDKLNQTIQEWEQLERRNSRVIAAHKDTDGNWGLAGGIAEGLAGPAAGVAAALEAQREAAITNQHNAVVRQQHGEIGRSIRDWITIYKQLKTGLEGELEKAKLAVVSDLSSDDVFSYLTVYAYPKSDAITDTGAVKIMAGMYAYRRIEVFEDVKGVIDGVVSVTVYQEEKVIGTTKLVLPMEGVSSETVWLDGIVLGTAKKGVDLTVKFAPVDLWIIEA